MSLLRLEATANGVVGCSVQSVYGLIAMVFPAAHLALQPRDGAPVDDHRGMNPIGVGALGGELDQSPHELGTLRPLFLARSIARLFSSGASRMLMCWQYSLISVPLHLGKRMWEALAA